MANESGKGEEMEFEFIVGPQSRDILSMEMGI